MRLPSLRKSAGARLVIIGVLVLGLLIPMAMVRSLIKERESRKAEAVAEVSGKWGKGQVITGPVLTIPYRVRVEDEVEENEGGIKRIVRKERLETFYAHFLPERLEIVGDVAPEVRYRGIYDVVVYTAELTITGSFLRPDFAELEPAADEVRWENAFLSMGISDLIGVRDAIRVEWGGASSNASYEAVAGLISKDVVGSGVTAKVSVSPEEGAPKAGADDFSIPLRIAGSGALLFAPVGKVTDVRLASGWRDPSFEGRFLPGERTVSEEGFSAVWRVLHLNRNYPQRWVGRSQSIAGSEFGVRLFRPVNEYQQTMRAAKYAVLFIGLTFLALFMMETLTRKAIHPIQYLFIGAGLALFYTLLMALSEHVRFGLAYLIAAGMMAALITLYARSVMGNWPLASAGGGVLLLLYGFLYVLIRQQDYALLVGSLSLFGLLALVMLLTRRVDWFTFLGGPGANPDRPALHKQKELREQDSATSQ